MSQDNSTPGKGTHRQLEVVEYDSGVEGYQNVEKYDGVRYEGRANLYKQRVMSNAYKALLGPLQSRKILDVGCGTGRGVIEFGQEAGFSVGSDASTAMLAVAQRKNQASRRCNFVASFAQVLPFANDSFDAVTSLNFLHLFSLETQRAMINEMKRVTRPGGTLVLEFDNALHGLGLGLFKRWTGRERGSLPGEIRSVIGNDCRLVRIYGAVFPIVWRWLCWAPAPSAQLEKIAHLALLNRVSHRVYYKLQKPQR